MESGLFTCQHICKNSCASINEALRRETAAVRFYESVLENCNSPEIKTFLTELMEERRVAILKMIQKLNEIHARSQVIDGMISSFD
ncbi:MAG: hypothetical protein IAE91_15635 [Ignavibacteriaceae bacterium]|nr:hypothetical protein [Ignavibacteriaceae bacterium]